MAEAFSVMLRKILNKKNCYSSPNPNPNVNPNLHSKSNQILHNFT